MQPLRIAIFHNLPAGGAKRVVFEHARQLVKRGHQLDVFTTSASDPNFLPLTGICQKERVFDAPLLLADAPQALPGILQKVVRQFSVYPRMKRLLDQWEILYGKMAAEIDAAGYDLVYAHNCRILQSPYLLRALETPAVYYCQDSLRMVHEWAIEMTPGYDTTSPGWGRVRFRGRILPVPMVKAMQEQETRDTLNARAATVTLANSHYSREVFLREYGIDSHVCYLGVDSHFYQPSGQSRERVVVAVGSISPHKRYDFLVSAVATIASERRPSIRIFGYDLVSTASRENPYLTALQAKAEANGVQLEIVRTATDEAIRSAYQTAGVVAFMPHLEPFGLIPLEAMACGAPVVGVAEAGVRESIQDGETGLLTERDPVEFGAAIDRLLCDTALANRLSAQGRIAVTEQWSWERSTNRLEHLMNHIPVIAQSGMAS